MTPNQEPEQGSEEATQVESELKVSTEDLNASRAVVSGLEREREKKKKSEKRKGERK